MDKIYHFSTDIALVYGVEEAIMIANFAFWIDKNEANEKHFYNGRTWTYNSIKAFGDMFPFWSPHKIRRILQSLEDKKVLMTGDFNSDRRNRTIWYSFTDEFLQSVNCICQNGQMQLSNPSNAFAKTGKCKRSTSIINNNNNTDNKHTHTAEGSKRARKGTTENLCLFADSRYYDRETFEKEFDYPEFESIDIMYYYHAVADWSSSKGKKAKDWIATTRNFIRKDIDTNTVHRVHMAASSLSPDAIEYLQSMGHV